MVRPLEKTVLLERGGVIYELCVSGDPSNLCIEEVVNQGTEKNLDPIDFELSLTHDEWTTIGEQYGRAQ